MEEDHSKDPRVLAGRYLMLIGFADLLRLPVEYHVIHESGPYQLLVALDAVIGLIAFGSGWGLSKCRPWAWKWSLGSWGALVGSSTILCIYIAPKYTDRLLNFDLDKGYWAITPRMLLYVTILALTPYVIWHLGTSSRWGSRERTTAAGWLSAGAIVALILSAAIMRR